MSDAEAERPQACQHDLFEAQAQRTPEAPAIVFDGASLSYAELDARANRLAHHLRAEGVGPDVLVGVCVERSHDLAVGLLGVLKAGGACVPLDPSFPPERLAFMVDDAALATVLTTDALVTRLPATGTRLVRLDGDAIAWISRPPTSPPRGVGPEHVGYVIYTSGSTGRPNGVLLTHRGLVNHHRAAVDLYGLGPGDRVVQFCSIGFDASIEEIFPTWAAGAAVVLRSRDVPILGRGWLAWLRAQRITVLNLPTAYWHEWARDLDRLHEVLPAEVRLVIVGGEKAQGRAYRTWLRVGGGGARWVNAYGPTEATCMSTVYERPPESGDDDRADDWDPPIGRPLPNTTTLIVGEDGQAVGPGATGELLLGGAGLARGYLNRPGLTAERFVDGAAEGRERLYRTGDMVRLLASGDLEYLGRSDDQVKIRGFRVECGEVEGALAAHPGVAEAVVVARPDPAGQQGLVGYVVATGAATTAPGELRRFLSERLPDHMVPGAFVTLDAFPLTPNGKLDRAGLPAPDPAPATDRQGRRPGTPTEQQVAAIWACVLGVDVESIGAEDDFFDLGGHSLLATQVIAQVREAFGTETPLRAIFEAPTVAGLAVLVADEGTGSLAHPPLVPVPRPPGARFPLSLAQEQMWSLELAADPPGLYNVTAVRRFNAPVDASVLEAALTHLVDRHETLRTCFVVEGGRPHQVVAPSVPVVLGVSDLRGVAGSEREEELQRRTALQDGTPFDPGRAPLFRAHLFHLGDDESRLVVTLDHLICDGTAADIFMDELAEAGAAISERRSPDLAPLAVQFADFAVWQRRRLTEEILQDQLDWWAKELDGMPLGPAVPFDRVPVRPTRRISSRCLLVTSDVRRRLDQLARATQSSVFVVCTAAVQSLLGRVGGITDVVVSTTLRGRPRIELEGLISTFAGVGRIRTDLSGDPGFSEIVSRARRSVLGLFEHQDIPFMRVRQALLPDFPTGGAGVAAALPVELGYFHVPGAEAAEHELFFRGQLHPLSLTLLDDGHRINAEISYKLDFYDEETIIRLLDGLECVLHAAAADPSRRLSELPVPPPHRR